LGVVVVVLVFLAAFAFKTGVHVYGKRKQQDETAGPLSRIFWGGPRNPRHQSGKRLGL